MRSNCAIAGITLVCERCAQCIRSPANSLARLDGSDDGVRRSHTVATLRPPRVRIVSNQNRSKFPALAYGHDAGKLFLLKTAALPA